MREKGSKPPGPVLLLFVFAALTVLACLHYDIWPPRFSSSQWWDGLIWAVGAIATLAACALIWAIRTLYVLGRDRRWSWWVLPVPLVASGFLLVSFVVQPISFSDVRGEFETVAVEMMSSSEENRSNVEIGPFDFYTVSKFSENAVYFMEAGGLGLTTTSGWVYSPRGKPAGFDDFDATHVDGPWYQFNAVWRS